MRDLIRNCHEGARGKKALMRRGWQLFRALLDQGVVSLVSEGRKQGVPVAVNVGLQTDFSMNQALSLYLVNTVSLIDSGAVDYAWVVLSLVESILEDPQLILRRQLDKVKAAAISQMKAEGVPFEKRMEELELLEYPKPNRDFIYSTFNEFSSRHPWVGLETIKPKSIVREMLEESRSFSDYVKVYQLERSEGLLLRHISTVHKALSQTVPDSVKNSELFEMETYLGALVRQVDSSLLERWAEMKSGRVETGAADTGRQEAFRPRDISDITADKDRFESKVHAVAMAFIRAFSCGDYSVALGLTAPASGDQLQWTDSDLELAHAHYLRNHQRVRLDAEGRNRKHLYFLKDQRDEWRVQQMIVDPEDKNDWVIEFMVDLKQSRERSVPNIVLSGCGPLGELINVTRWRV
jgi:hypothetical protein